MVPEPLMVPLAHSRVLLTVSALLPPSVPPENVSVGVVVATLFRFSVPALRLMKPGFSVPLAGVNVCVPPETVIEAGFIAVLGASVVVPPKKVIVPVRL